MQECEAEGPYDALEQAEGAQLLALLITASLQLPAADAEALRYVQRMCSLLQVTAA